MKMMVGLIAVVMTAGAAYQAAAVFEPIALALFIMANLWPLHSWLQSRIPALAALALSIFCAVAICLIFASLVAWGFGRVGHSLIIDSNRYQALYASVAAWLDQHGISIAGLWAEHFNVSWLLRTAQQITGRVNTTMSFWLIAFVYVILGLLEVDKRAKECVRLTAAKLPACF